MLDFETDAGICALEGSQNWRVLYHSMGTLHRKGTTMETKMDYEAPTLIEVGSFEEITKSAGGNSSIDSDFNDGTPTGDLTFS